MTTSDQAGWERPLRGVPRWRPGDDLWRLETEMRHAAKAGELLDRGEGPSDLAAMRAWGPERRVRAAVLRHLLVDKKWQVHAKGVRLRGIRIVGYLDLQAATLRCPLRLENCYLDEVEGINLHYATISLLEIMRCHLTAFRGNALVVTKDLNLSGSRFAGPIILNGADITGLLSCRDTKLTGTIPTDMALVGYGMKVGGSVFLERFNAPGAVNLSAAQVTGHLTCSGAQLTEPDSDGNVLVADQLQVGRSVFLNDGFTAAGAVQLTGADITGDLDCSGAQLKHANSKGSVLNADALKSGGDAFFSKEFTAAGAVWLTGADIAGDLDCSGAQLNRADIYGDALAANGLKVGGEVYFNDGFTAAGTVSIGSAQIGGSLWLSLGEPIEDASRELADAEAALDATGAQILHKLWWSPAAQVTRLVILEDAEVGQLEDSWAEPARDPLTKPIDRPNGYWPRADQGLLRLDGFIYNRIGGEQQAEYRLEWIGSYPKPPWLTRVASAMRAPRTAWLESKDRRARRHARARHGFAPRPYEQLAEMYQHSGRDREARKVALARRRDLRLYGNLTWYRKALNWLLDITIQYGYQTWRAVAGVAFLYVVVVAFFWFARYHNAVIPVQAPSGLRAPPTAAHCTSHYPCFNPFGYAVDTVVPLINVHQADFWSPNASVSWGRAGVAITYLGTGFGWLFATLAVAGYTGLVRNTDAL